MTYNNIDMNFFVEKSDKQYPQSAASEPDQANNKPYEKAGELYEIADRPHEKLVSYMK